MGESLMKCVSIQSCQIVCTFQCGICRRIYPSELHSAVRSVLSEPPLNPDWSDKGRQIAALFTPYGDREYQGDLLYRTRLHGEDGISFFFDEGYTYIPWNGLAFLLDAMIEDSDYCTELFGEDVQIAAASHDLFAKRVNGQIYRPLVEKYIAGEKRL